MPALRKPRRGHYTAVILDIGDVLFTWSIPTKTTISPSTMKSMLSHPVWHEFERGKITSSDCYDRLAKAFSISTSGEVSDAFQEARTTLILDPTLTELLHDIKHMCTNELRLYVMSNMSREDFDYLKGLDAPWDLFDGAFASGYAGMRKPDLEFFDLVLRGIEMEGRPGEVLFVDDKLENIQAAERMGIHGVQFTSGIETSDLVRSLLGMEDGHT